MNRVLIATLSLLFSVTSFADVRCGLTESLSRADGQLVWEARASSVTINDANQITEAYFGNSAEVLYSQDGQTLVVSQAINAYGAGKTLGEIKTTIAGDLSEIKIEFTPFNSLKRRVGKAQTVVVSPESIPSDENPATLSINYKDKRFAPVVRTYSWACDKTK